MGDLEDPMGGFQYIPCVMAFHWSAMVYFSDPLLYGDGPYPTVVEYLVIFTFGQTEWGWISRCECSGVCRYGLCEYARIRMFWRCIRHF